jgi:hypothetical protein
MSAIRSELSGIAETARLHLARANGGLQAGDWALAAFFACHAIEEAMRYVREAYGEGSSAALGGSSAHDARAGLASEIAILASASAAASDTLGPHYPSDLAHLNPVEGIRVRVTEADRRIGREGLADELLARKAHLGGARPAMLQRLKFFREAALYPRKSKQRWRAASVSERVARNLVTLADMLLNKVALR